MGLKAGEKQMSMIVPNVEELVSVDHTYREILRVLDWRELTNPLQKLYSKGGRKGYAVKYPPQQPAVIWCMLRMHITNALFGVWARLRRAGNVKKFTNVNFSTLPSSL